jgi:flavin reductase (DIM6/NTAB) family NADH-FMN oxidoreductase RutF
VSTVNEAGVVNLAPFSFFTGVCWHPPALAFSVANRDDGTKKDTLVNIENTGEFVVHTVAAGQLAMMERTAQRLPVGADAEAFSDIRLVPVQGFAVPRMAAAKVAFACRRVEIVRVGAGAGGGNLIVGLVERMFVADGVLMDGPVADWRALEPLGRLSGNRYVRVTEVVQSETN